MSLGTAILLAAVISAVGGLIAMASFKAAMRQRKACACKKCWHQGNDGLCWHRNPVVDENHVCISYKPCKDESGR